MYHHTNPYSFLCDKDAARKEKGASCCRRSSQAIMEVLAAVIGWAIQIMSRSSSADSAPLDIQNLTAKALFWRAGLSTWVKRLQQCDVKYANELNIPYLTISGAHGAITTVGSVHQGIGIWLNGLDSVEIAPDGSTVNIGGGALTKTVTDTLWAAGKQTVTGICECTGMLGVGLGGGHGALQGRYGLVSDQFVSINLVLANGTMIMVNENQHPDLWWAMRGAGHNFGVGTFVSAKIYDVQEPNWAYESFIYTGDKVADVFDTINREFPRGTQPVDVLTLVLFINNYDVDPTRPLVAFYVLQEGVLEVDPAYTNPFQAISPIVTTPGSGPYTDLPSWIGEDNNSPSCMKAGLGNVRFPINLEFYNSMAMQSAFTLFATTTQETPALNNSVFLFEGYSLQAVKAIHSNLSAYPFRQDNYLVYPLLICMRDGPELDEIAATFGEVLRQILYGGSQQEELHTYVNSAFGDETARNW
ncbi:FAD binding domain protein [Xylariaceae sp. FL0255]|nr:FAD binding domain protein [Xylariaceae sp. FL0255]